MNLHVCLATDFSLSLRFTSFFFSKESTASLFDTSLWWKKDKIRFFSFEIPSFSLHVCFINLISAERYARGMLGKVRESDYWLNRSYQCFSYFRELHHNWVSSLFHFPLQFNALLSPPLCRSFYSFPYFLFDGKKNLFSRKKN